MNLVQSAGHLIRPPLRPASIQLNHYSLVLPYVVRTVLIMCSRPWAL